MIACPTMIIVPRKRSRMVYVKPVNTCQLQENDRYRSRDMYIYSWYFPHGGCIIVENIEPVFQDPHLFELGHCQSGAIW